MRRLHIIIWVCAVFQLASAQKVSRSYIPHGALFYNSRWQPVPSADKASYYRVLAVDEKGQKMFYDYFITGQLQAEKHYTSLDRQNDRRTVLTGVCRTFHKSGRVESVMQYRNGKADGRALSFFPSGNIGMKLSYRNGVLDGPCYTYDENGHLEYTTVWRNGAKVREIQGGKDHYIDRQTNEDAFCERFRHDEALIMAQSKTISRTRESGIPEPGESEDRPEKHVTSDVRQEDVRRDADFQGSHTAGKTPSKARDGRPSKDMTKEQKLVADVKYPDRLPADSASARDEKTVTASEDGQSFFPFSYLYGLLSREEESLKRIDELTGLGRRLRLEDTQTVNGYGAQKEIILHHHLPYDAQTGKDRVTGDRPRQAGFFGSSVGDSLSINRINLFTWSEAEMRSFARKAVECGYAVLGGGDYRTLDGNFILERKGSPTAYGEREVILTFTHQSGLYAGLYHIQMDVR